MNKVLILLILVVGVVRAGIYPVWFKQYKGEFNVTMCWSSLDDDHSLRPCHLGFERVWEDLYDSMGGGWRIDIASMYTDCPAFMMNEMIVYCYGKHRLIA